MCLSSFIFEVEEDWEENRIATKSHRREEWGLGGKSTIQSNMNDCELITGFLKALVNGDALLRTLYCPWCFLGCANWETFVADTKCFWTKSETFFVSRTQNLCPQQMLHAGKRGNICVGNIVSATMCPRLPGPYQNTCATGYHTPIIYWIALQPTLPARNAWALSLRKHKSVNTDGGLSLRRRNV